MNDARSAAEIVGLYIEQAWNESRTELVRELCADPIIRHYAEKTVTLSHDEQIARIKKVNETKGPRFTEVSRSSDGIYVTSIWNNVYADGSKTCGIQVYKVVEGRIIEAWNPLEYDRGNWA